MFPGTRLQRKRRARWAKTVIALSLGVVVLTPKDLSRLAPVLEAVSLIGVAHAQEKSVAATSSKETTSP